MCNQYSFKLPQCLLSNGAPIPTVALLVFVQPVLPCGLEGAAVVRVALEPVLAGVERLVERDVVVIALGPAKEY